MWRLGAGSGVPEGSGGEPSRSWTPGALRPVSHGLDSARMGGGSSAESLVAMAAGSLVGGARGCWEVGNGAAGGAAGGAEGTALAGRCGPPWEGEVGVTAARGQAPGSERAGRRARFRAGESQDVAGPWRLTEKGHRPRQDPEAGLSAWPWAASSPVRGAPVSSPVSHFHVLRPPGEEPPWVWLAACRGLQGKAGARFMDTDTWHTHSKPFPHPWAPGAGGSGQRESHGDRSLVS